jgi:GNAT superfamily N-acetyltransferase
VASAHVAIGFQSLGTLEVLVKPLLPFALLGRHFGLAPIAGIAPALDAMSAPFLAIGGPSPPPGVRIEAAEISTPHLETLLALLERLAGPRIHERWTVNSWRRRFGATIEGDSYTLLLAMRGGACVAGVLARTARRPSPLPGRPFAFGVVMDLIAEERDRGIARALLAEAERRAHLAGCQAMLWLDGVRELRTLFAVRGYRKSPETYRLLGWPAAQVPEGSASRDPAAWRFPFAEHDAF